jgi:hypothetical protein
MFNQSVTFLAVSGNRIGKSRTLIRSDENALLWRSDNLGRHIIVGAETIDDRVRSKQD